MLATLVGTRGDIVSGTKNAAVTPAWGVDENRSAPNLLLCWVAVFTDGSAAASPATPTGWSVAFASPAATGSYSSARMALFYRVATGGEVAPTITASGSDPYYITAALAEVSGTLAVPLDQTAVAVAPPNEALTETIQNPSADVGFSDLVVGLGVFCIRGSSPPPTTTIDFNNGVVPSELTAGVGIPYSIFGNRTAARVDFTLGTTTGNSVADAATMTGSGTLVNYTLLGIASFQAGVTLTDTPTMTLQIAEPIVDAYDNLNYEDAPLMRLGVSETLVESTVPPGIEFPGLILFVSITVNDSWDRTDVVSMVVAPRIFISAIEIAEHIPLIRERPPLGLSVNIEAADGTVYRWARDEPKPENSPRGLSFSSTMPGGFEHCDLTLARRPDVEYRDLAEFSTVTVRSAGGQIVWQGRLETAPRTSGEQISIVPGAVGWQAALDDDKAVRALYVHRQLSAWQAASVQRTLDYLATSVDVASSSIAPDTSGYAALNLSFTGPWARTRVGEAWLDAKDVPLARVYAAWNANANIAANKSGWRWGAGLSDDDRAYGAGTYNSMTLTNSTPGSAVVSTTTTTRTWAMVHVECSTAQTNEEGKDYSVYFTCLAVYGDYPVPLRGSTSATDAWGFYASDIVAHAVSTWAPALTVTTGADGTVQPSSFIIPHAAWLDATTVSQIVRDTSRFDLQNWGVFDLNGRPAFYWAPRGYFGRRWRAMVGPSGLSETGPQVDRLWNRVVVQYQAVDGRMRTVGPTGTGSDDVDASLADLDPLNAVTAAGLTRTAVLQMQTATLASATAVGQSFLVEQKALSTAGEATLTGFVSDDRGVIWPASYVRAGDTISFTDSSSPEYRHIVKASYSDDTKQCQISLDSPAEGLAAVLERLNVVLIPIGV